MTDETFFLLAMVVVEAGFLWMEWVLIVRAPVRERVMGEGQEH